MPTTLTVDERLDALEAALARIEKGQAQAVVDAERRASAAARLVTDQFAAQTSQILTLSQNLNAVSSSISRWGAAGCLLCAVILFIAVRALGF